MTALQKIKLQLKVALGTTPSVLQPAIRAMLWLGCQLGAVKKEKYLYAKLGFPPTVHTGPFQGMRYLPVNCGSALLPKIAGTYEMELHPVMERLKGEGVDLVLDVGSAEGYYAIGLTRLLNPKATHCFDIDDSAHPTMWRLAELNGVKDKIITHGWCDAQSFEQLLAPARKPLVMMDCEGGEYDLLDPVKAPVLRRAMILVETHGWKNKLGKTVLEDRFSATHQITRVNMLPRVPRDCPYQNHSLTESERMAVVDEIRPFEYWLFLEPKAA